MEDMKRWSVTYTKHIKQKRKVYQDGMLMLHSSTNKVMLYDDCEKLLESRLLKKDEFVKSGETLAFNNFLIDVGDPEGDHKTLSELNFRGADNKSTKNARLTRGQKFGNNSALVDRKTNSEKNNASLSNPSVSHKIIREFKKSELHKYKAPLSCLDTTKSSITEWQALYTTQIAQKAKKYHDGILRLEVCGSERRQAMLYDASRKLLDSKFLKKDEVVGSGQSIAFDAHLVDIGEPEEKQKSIMDLNVQQSNYNEVGQTGMLHGQDNVLMANKAVIREWHALYTAQITQKTKKYHDGILRLSSCGSRQMQVTLLKEDGTILGSKCVKLSANVGAGSTIELEKYLVEVGEPLASSEGEPQNDNCYGKDMDSNFSSLTVDRIKLSKRVPINEPLRDAHQILSILKKPMALESIVQITAANMEQCHALQSTHLVQFDLKDQAHKQLKEDSKNLNRSALGNSEEDLKALDERETTIQPFKSKMSVSKSICSDLSSEIVKLADSESSGELLPNNCDLSSFSLGLEASNTLRPDSDAVYTDKSRMRPGSPTDRLQVSDADALHFHEDFQSPNASVPHDGSNENTDIGESHQLTSSKVMPSCSGSQSFKDIEMGNSHQINAGMEIDAKWSEGTFSSGISSSDAFASHVPGDVENKISEELKTAQETDKCPSFDLGF